MNTLESYEKKQLESLSSGKSYPSFGAGDTIKVHLKVKEGENIEPDLVEKKQA